MPHSTAIGEVGPIFTISIWGDAMNNGQHRDALRETEPKRLSLLGEIGAKRNSTVIAYLTSARPGVYNSDIDFDDMLVIEPHVRAARKMGARNIDLFLVTHGGVAVAPWGVVAMIREHFKTGGFRVILPSVAYSAGSSISLGADEIVMGPGSIMGPVDTQIHFPSGAVVRHASASDLQGFLDFLGSQRLSGRAIREKIPDWFTSRMDAPAVGALYRLWKENRRKVMKLLSSRRPQLSQGQNDRIADFMLYGIGNHGQSIRRTEARENGISFITDVEKSGIEEQTSELFAIYADILKLTVPHARPSATLIKMLQEGDEADYDAYGAHLSETPVAIVESEFDTNPAYVAYDLRHWNRVPPVLHQDEPISGANVEPETPERGQRSTLPLRRALWVSTRTLPQR